jgi:PAS domain S-box-containing protein
MSGSREDSAVDAEEGVDEQPRLLLFVEPGQNRSLLAETLGEQYRVDATTGPSALEGVFDLCVLGRGEFARVAEEVKARREQAPTFLPFLLLTEGGETQPAVFDYVDDVLELPVAKEELRARVSNLVDRRRTERRLAEREQKLAATVDELRRKEKAIDEAPVGFTLTEAGGEDRPMVYANTKFEEMTGYEGSEVIGRDCRFLQGEETRAESRRRIREALRADEPVSVDIVNYRKDGRKFWNKLDIAPVYGEGGEVVNYVGFQTDITHRKIRERRTEVLNRVLSHNLRNKMNIIEVYVDMLRADYDGDPPESLQKIETAASNLLTLAETVRETDRILSQVEADSGSIELGEQLTAMMSGFRDRYPEVEFEIAVPDGNCTVSVGGLVDAIEEAIDNAVKHNDSDQPRVRIEVSHRTEWVDIEIQDNGPGIPDQEIDVLRTGEAALRHADRMGIWLIYWTVSRSGGTLSIRDADGSGTVLSIAVPADCGD